MTYIHIIVAILGVGIIYIAINYLSRQKKVIIPPDIVQKIKKDFPGTNTQNEVAQLIEKIMKDNFMVGNDQLARSVIIIANGYKNKIKEIIESNYYGDPRDVIMDAMAMPGNTMTTE